MWVISFSKIKKRLTVVEMKNSVKKVTAVFMRPMVYVQCYSVARVANYKVIINICVDPADVQQLPVNL